MAEFLLNKTEKYIFFIFFENLKYYKILRNGGHCTRRCACRTYYEVKNIKYVFILISELSWTLCSFGRSKRGDIFKPNVLSTFLHIQFFSNSHLLVLCREKRHFKSYGIAANWNRTGYFELGHSVRKYRIKYLTNCVIISPGQWNGKWQQIIFI